MSPAILVPISALVALALHAARSALRGRRAATLLAELGAEQEGRPVFRVAALHLDPRGAALVACDARATLLHLASYRGGRIESARLPAAHLESVAVLENGESADDESRGRTVDRVTLRVAIADERRSFHDIDFLGARALRGSARHRRAVDACRRWASVLSGEMRATGIERPGVALGEAGTSTVPAMGAAGTDGADGEGGSADEARAAFASVWPVRTRVAQATLAALLTLVVIGAVALSGPAGRAAVSTTLAETSPGAVAPGNVSPSVPTASIDASANGARSDGVALAGASPSVERTAFAATADGGASAVSTRLDPASPAAADADGGDARAFARELSSLRERLAAFADTADLDESGARPADIVARVAGLDAIERRVAWGRSLSLDDDTALVRDELAERVRATRAEQLPRYRALFARATRRGSSPVGAWASGEGNAVLELTRLDLEDADTRARVWDALAAQTSVLRFARVDFRTYRGATLLESRRPEPFAEGTPSPAESL